MSVEMKAGSSAQTGAPRALFKSPLQVDSYVSLWDVSADGERFLFGEAVGESTKSVTVVLNWLAEVKQ